MIDEPTNHLDMAGREVVARYLRGKHGFIVYIWDEPLDYIDLESREQIENMLAESKATMIFVEHDHAFAERIAGKTVRLP